MAAPVSPAPQIYPQALLKYNALPALFQQAFITASLNAYYALVFQIQSGL